MKQAIPFRNSHLLSELARFKESFGAHHFLKTSWEMPVRNILLTGATGAFGIYLLQALLQEVDHVVCLVRAETSQQALARLQKNARKYAINIRWDQVRIVLGDMSRPNLGMSPSEYSHLTESIDSVVNSAANTSFIVPYEVSRKVNVGGMLELLRLCQQGRPKHFHQISSCSVRVAESYASDDEDIGLYNGYSQSKCISDWLVRDFANHGLTAMRYGIGYLQALGDRVNAEDSWESFLKVCLEFKKFPDLDACFDYAPIGHVARSIARYVADPQLIPLTSRTEGKVEMHHPRPLKWRNVGAALKRFDPELEILPEQQFREVFNEKMEQFRGKKVYAVKLMFSRDFASQARLMFAEVPSGLPEVPSNEDRRIEDVLAHISSHYEWI